MAHANAMLSQVQLWTTIPTCVGVAETKTLAKLANAAAKKDPQFDGVADLRDDGVRRDVMHAFAVGDVWGVGGATARKLTDLGITPISPPMRRPKFHYPSGGREEYSGNLAPGTARGVLGCDWSLRLVAICNPVVDTVNKNDF